MQIFNQRWRFYELELEYKLYIAVMQYCLGVSKFDQMRCYASCFFFLSCNNDPQRKEKPILPEQHQNKMQKTRLGEMWTWLFGTTSGVWSGQMGTPCSPTTRDPTTGARPAHSGMGCRQSGVTMTLPPFLPTSAPFAGDRAPC